MSLIILRKKIKFFLEKHIFPTQIYNQIDHDSYKSFSKKIDIGVINLSVIPWNYRFQRPQQIAKNVSLKGIHFFYVNNEFLITNSINNPPFKSNYISPNLFDITLSSGNNYFIYQDTPIQKDVEIISNSINNLIRTAQIKKPILKVDHPFWEPIVAKLNLPVLYDCLDNQDNFELNSDNTKEKETNLFKSVNKVITTSQFLFNRAIKYRSKNDVVLISNGTDYKHFSKDINIDPKNDLSKYPKPIFGYFGAIENWLDINFIEKLSRNTKGSIILVGQNNLHYQPRNPNIYLLGEKPYKSLPQFLTQFDVCLIPFILNSLTKAVNPVKIYEYFSQGKAVITSKLPELKKYKNNLYFYSKNTDILNLINKINNEEPEKVTERQTIAQNNTWESKADKIITVLKEI